MVDVDGLYIDIGGDARWVTKLGVRVGDLVCMWIYDEPMMLNDNRPQHHVLDNKIGGYVLTVLKN
jgi:putative aminopeptidase FrvX